VEKSPFFIFLHACKSNSLFALFKAQEDGVFTATCHTSKTRHLKIFEMRFSHPFSASANAH
jgi:hypothetical protein